MDEVTGENTLKKSIPRKKICNLSTQNFAEIVDVSAFVDKTLFIKAFLEADDDMIVVLAPSRFGKSTNMDMVKEFVSGNNKLFQDNNLKIYEEEKDFFVENCKKNPVIHLDFKNLIGNTRDQIFESMKELIQGAYNDHRYLVTSIDYANYVWSDKKKFEGVMMTVTDFIRYWKYPKDLEENEVIIGLRRLSHCLHLYHNKPVYVFIDDFDTTIMRAIIKTNTKDAVLHELIYLINEIMFDFLKRNKNIKRALINASTQVAEVLSLNVNNIQYYEVLRKPSYAQYFGFTDKEVTDLFERDEFVTLKNSEVQKWYEGYKVMHTKDCVTYNSYLILNYLQDSNTIIGKSQIKNYLVGLVYITNLKELFTIPPIREFIAKLLNEEAVEINTIDKISEDEIFTLKSLMHQELNVLRYEDVCLFLQFLVGIGYLNAVKCIERNLQLITIPNDEIKQLFREKYYNAQLIEQKYDLKPQYIQNYVEALNRILKVPEKVNFILFAKAVNLLFLAVIPENVYELYNVLFTFIYKFKEYKITVRQINGTDDILLILGNVGMIIRLNFKEELPERHGYETAFNNDENVTVKIFSNLKINYDRIVTLSYSVDNSPEECVTSQDIVD